MSSIVGAVLKLGITYGWLAYTFRALGRLEDPFDRGGLRVDLERREVAVDGVAVKLTPIEYRLLTTMVKHAGRVLTHHQLLTEVWGPQQAEQAHYLRVYAAQLRRKLEADPARPRYILTEPGIGYRFIADE